MATQAYFKLLADYNAWANARLYDATAELSDADYRKDMGAFFWLTPPNAESYPRG